MEDHWKLQGNQWQRNCWMRARCTEPRSTEALYKETKRKLHKNRIVIKTCHKFSWMRQVIIFNLSLLVHYFSNYTYTTRWSPKRDEDKYWRRSRLAAMRTIRCLFLLTKSSKNKNVQCSVWQSFVMFSFINFETNLQISFSKDDFFHAQLTIN